MADKDWKVNISIQTAKSVSKKLNKKAIIMILFTDTTFEVVSYGQNGAICKEAGKLADKIYTALTDDTLWWDELNDELRN